MASYGRHLAASADALSKKQRLRGLAATRRTEGEVAARFISIYGFAISNGTLVKLAEKIIYSSRNRPALLPIVLFFICMMFAGTGAGAPATFAFLSPLVMTICIKSKISRVLATVLIFCGSTIGSQFPFSVGGIIIQQVAENSGFHNEGMAMCMNVLMNSLVTMSIFFVITYFVTGGHRTKKVEINKPEPFTAV